MEWLWMVDEHDRPLAPVERERAHRDGLPALCRWHAGQRW